MVYLKSAAAIPTHVLAREDMQDAIKRHDFGQIFFLARKYGGISFSKIADACGIKPERVGTLARGQGSIATYEKIAVIADALQIPGHMLGLAPRKWEVHAGTEAEGVQALERREFLRMTALGAGAALAVPTSLTLAAGNRIGANVPNLLKARTARLRRLDDVLGGGDTFRLYLQEYQTTKTLLRDGIFTEQTRNSLLSVLSEQAQQAGWAAFDGGDQVSATKLYRDSHRLALESSDRALAGNALAFLAYQELAQNPHSAVQAAEESCATAGPQAPRSVQALLHERRAWAHAVAGNGKESEGALSMAQTALDANEDAQEPDWSNWVDARELQIMTGRCWTELGRPLRAVPVLEKVLGQFDDAHARDKALYSCWLAESYMLAGEVEHAASVAERVIDLSTGVASVRPRRQISKVIQRLTEYRQEPSVSALLEKAGV